ncbi:MAG: hypothetical protein JRJ86_13620 [Deltaproteobacteria bacterium]|nr:hypothetical protein [Deltaproteobacteria bacterium]MBW2117829.1 hypothetical protein [Deltaproteobacteria bacterium]MBW2344899.1 hypothetical protein [Deltaproteobacteria bacterium]
MGLYVLKSRRKILEIISLIISKELEIKVWIKEGAAPFTSSLIHYSSPTGEDLESSAAIEKAGLIMQKLTPAQGNTLIQSSSDILVECEFSHRSLRFKTGYVGISTKHPHFGIIVGFPESLELQDTRKEERSALTTPDFISVEFKLGKAPGKDYQVGVIDCSSHGLGLLITKKDMELLQMLKQGDKIKEMTCYAARAMITVDAEVKHITKIEEGNFKGQYIIGIESREIIESCRPPWELEP